MRRAQRAITNDTAAIALTRASDGWRVWIVAAAVLAAGGGRFGGRAAVRGVVSAGLATATAQAAIKPIVARRRPRRPPRLRPIAYMGSRHTASFPSSHTAVASAFALGAAQELPWSAVATLPLAAGIGWARVRTREHHASDVYAGAALGAAAALATRRLWPVAPHEAATARPALHRVHSRPQPDGDGVHVVVNPSAGPALSRDPSDQLRDALPNATVTTVDDGSKMEAALRDAATGDATVLGVSGGDGSVNTAAGIALEHDLPLLVVPGGTLNHFARDLGFSSVDATFDAVLAGELAEVDVGRLGDRRFLNTASFGAYSELVDAREQLERRIGKWPALLVALARVLWRSEPCRVELDGDERRIWMIFIGNCRYHPSGFAPSWRERLDDGLLDIRVVDAQHPWSRTRLLFAVFSGRLGRSRIYEQRAAPRLRVRALDGPLRLAADGETFDGPDELVIDKLPERLTVVAPRG
jgi:undecaprenyl-diphosphatase